LESNQHKVCARILTHMYGRDHTAFDAGVTPACRVPLAATAPHCFPYYSLYRQNMQGKSTLNRKNIGIVISRWYHWTCGCRRRPRPNPCEGQDLGRIIQALDITVLPNEVNNHRPPSSRIVSYWTNGTVTIVDSKLS
jgi:hypothetical protein